jgi:uncharacterized protein YndB with AHSA1/START domain
MGREFEVRREVDLPGTPEQVWEAISTEAGLASWLFPEQVGEGVQAWEPPHHLAVRQEGEGWFNALEYTVEGRAGGTTLRYVHSGIFDDAGWDDQYDAVSQHTDFYLHTLGQYLEHFAPRTASYVGDVPGGISGPEASMAPDGFARLKAALGVDSGAEGDEVAVDISGRVEGVLDYARGNFLGIRTGDGLYRFFGRNAFGGPVAVTLHDFSGGDAAQTRQTLQAWLNSIYA